MWDSLPRAVAGSLHRNPSVPALATLPTLPVMPAGPFTFLHLSVASTKLSADFPQLMPIWELPVHSADCII